MMAKAIIFLVSVVFFFVVLAFIDDFEDGGMHP